MAQQSIPRSGGQLVADQLRIHGIDTAFCVPGESFLPILDGLYAQRESIRTIVCRQEGGATHMAEAYAKLTGKPGVCLVTRGPGATNASIGVHTARQDSTPLVLLVGQVETGILGREAWQEIDIARMFTPFAKWSVQVDAVERIPEILHRAFHVAASGRCGPVVVALPEDVLYATTDADDAAPYAGVQATPGGAHLARLRAMLAAAARPFVILGGGGWSTAACADIEAFVSAFDLPVGSAFRRQDLIDNRHPNYAGDLGIGINPKLAQRIREADLLLAIGPRLGETTTSGYTLIDVPRPRQKLVHVHADVDELGRVYQADLMIAAGPAEFAAAARALQPPASCAWREWTRATHAAYVETLRPAEMPGPVNLGEVVSYLRDRLPADAIVTNGAGNYSGWVHRFYQYRGFRTQVAPTSGTMGYGLPAACAAALAYPGRTVVCFAGDGCFQMSSQELATARQYGLPIIVIVVNNGIYGSIRMHQEMHYPERVHATSLENPDFPALAAAYGLLGLRVERTEDFPAAFERALASASGALIEVVIDPDAITTRTTLTALRRAALEKAGAR
ncbi:MAG: thiamine pyrophosphate-binding protein [Burkholderiales bacterium]|nr:thiamine pyrophosphate-binding protein [Burkholderiales bacterium]